MLHRIVPAGFWPSLSLRELWEQRELVYFLAKRDIQVRYKQTALGIAWAILQPVLMMIVFSVFLGHFGRIPSDGNPYPVFVFAALLPWQLFSHAVTEASQSIVANEKLITRIYFPRLAIPIAALGSAFIDFFVGSVVMLLLVIYYHVPLTYSIVLLPLFVALALASALGVSLWLSALNVQYRDVRYALPFLTQIWLFATPVAYSSTMVPERWRWLVGLNPMAGVVEGFRWSLLAKSPMPAQMLFASVAVMGVVLVGGLFYFQKMETAFADVI